MSDPLHISLDGVPTVSRIDQYLGWWAIAPQHFDALVSMTSRINLAEHVKSKQAEIAARAGDGQESKPGDRYQNIDGVAVIELVGAMTKYGSSLSDNAGSVAMRRSVRLATQDPAVKGILIRIDSPGGSVAGTKDLADEIAAANAIKPVTAFIEDLGASAAFWVASQARSIVANNPSALVGAIGTYGVLYDHSAAAEKAGIRAIVVRAGEHKGAGAWGTQITPEQVAEYQRVVDSLNAHFKASVMTGRRMKQEQVDAVADGRIHTADQALKLGLIDAIQTMDQAIAALARPSTPRPGQAKAHHEENTVTQKNETQTTTEPTTVPKAEAPKAESPKADQPATVKELKAAFPKASDSFLLKCLEQGMTIAQAKDARLAELEARAPETTQAPAASVPGSVPGVKPLASKPVAQTEASDGTVTEQWEALVEKHMKRGGTKARAISMAAAAEPDLHRAYIEEINANRKSR